MEGKEYMFAKSENLLLRVASINSRTTTLVVLRDIATDNLILFPIINDISTIESQF